MTVMLSLFRELHQRNRLLSIVGWLHAVGLAIALVLALVDQRTILGINAWIKPIKFLSSAAIFLRTVAWLSAYVRKPSRSLTVISWGIAIAMLVENLLIAVQAGRGLTSHFNESTPLDHMIYAAMGVFILANTLLIAWLLVLFQRPGRAVDTVFLWGIRMGLATFIAGSLIGGIMVSNGAHSIGVLDGGAGLPFVNWSTEAGDLRVSHFVGLHALQILPLAGFLIRPLDAADLRTKDDAHLILRRLR